jgi:methyltransferase-like protein 6
VGNTIYPLLEINPQAHVHACDFSKRAVQLVQEHPQYGSGRVTAFVADITSTRLVDHVPPGSIDYCTMVFVLSAVAPENMGKVRGGMAFWIR